MFLQDTVDTFSNTIQAMQQEVPQQELSLFELLSKGGWVMIPLTLLALLGLIIFFERYLTIKKASKDESQLILQVKSSIKTGNLDSAIAICKSSNSPLGRMLQKGLLRVGRPIKEIEGSIENVGKLEVSKLEKNVGILGIIAGIAPMLGFVGTIIGVITIFHDVSVKGIIEIGTISGGLYVKMISSATGLIIGIVSYVFYNILMMMIDKVILKMETDSIEFIDLLEEPGR
ncbi:outer membrane transport energization protein ExbB [Pseudopedobacter saltans DSM 12145]|uniref:Outer membrane transport energization protein ExbB n=1 Tax=Pseudopedobacter saltans (strain ATCC 51119 / DSM 12145 / JCM 21818 / CCUG 39354 / LMG 10337 / NBRC 100064 / NCIMB 13643) TaxID=762903 RepID=F0S9C4_PSESL|nr:MotA/TolQ/ExbB proton channel family protein [Pseudopedobacter saltans]ADY52474.1 outer membrane transport energization protein ExbB [Pseudopedobacter saltans DSM 12145]